MISFLIFLFTYIPSIFVHAIVCAGICGLVISLFASKFIDGFFSATKKAIIKYAALGLLVIGLFLEGGLAVNNEYMEQVKEWNHKVELAEEKAKAVNEKIEYVYVDRVKEVQKVQYIVKEKIVKSATNIDKECKVVPEVIEILNEAAKK